MLFSAVFHMTNHPSITEAATNVRQINTAIVPLKYSCAPGERLASTDRTPSKVRKIVWIYAALLINTSMDSSGKIATRSPSYNVQQSSCCKLNATEP